MKKHSKISAILFAVILFICVTAFSASAGTYDENKVTVSTFSELEQALEYVSPGLSAPDRLVVLNNDITYTGSEIGTYITIEYPGKLMLDLAGHSIDVVGANTDNLFYLKGGNRTEFSIINTESETGSICFKSNMSASTVLFSTNANAIVNVLGSAEYATDESKDSSDHSIRILTAAVDSDNTNLHTVFYLSQIKSLYISGALIQNGAMNPCNVYFNAAPISKVLITGKSRFELTSSTLVESPKRANIHFAEKPITDSVKFGSCYVQAKGNVKSLHYAGLTVLNSSLIKSDDSQEDEYIEIYNPDFLSSGWNTAVDLGNTLNIVERCCADSNLERSTESTVAGHVTKCDHCGGVLGFTLHNFNKVQQKKVDSTCTENGTKVVYVCSIDGCEYTKGGETIEPKGHEYSSVYLTDREPTCTQSGSKSRHCTRCEAKTDAIAIPALGHNQGFNGTYCYDCRSVLRNFYLQTGTNEVLSGTLYIFMPSETNTYRIAASNGSQSLIFDELDIASLEGDEDSGYKVVLNSDVDIVEYNVDFVEVELQGGKAYAVAAHSSRISDFTVSIVCSVHSVVTDEAVAPTCTDSGLTAGKHCSACGKVLEVQEVIAATGHSYGSWKTTKKATCTAKGSQKKTCTVCGDVKTRSTKALGHDYSSDWTVDAQPTCTKAGSKSHHCTRCSAKSDVTEIAATGHSYTSKITKKATCATEGTRTYTCSKCKHTYTKSIAKLDHTYKTTVTKATTSKAGAKVTACTVCGKEKSRSAIAKIKTVTLSATSYTYNGKVKSPTVTVEDSNGKKLVSGTDYTVKYSSGRKNVGKYTVTVTFKGNYSGTKTLTFKINPKGTTVSKLTAGTKKFTVKWNKQSTQTTGYQIRYSTSSNMTNTKTVTVSGTSTTSKTVSNLKSGTKYYVQIRTYKTVDGVKYYSSWSKTQCVKTK